MAAISLSPGSAQAFVVTVGGVQYDVTTFTGTYNANISKFATAANGGLMPWWGEENGNLALVFATQVVSGLGQPISDTGPAFGYRLFGGVQNYRVDSSYNPFNQAVSDGQIFTYAQATLYTAPVPGPRPPACPWCRRWLRLQPQAEEAHQAGARCPGLRPAPGLRAGAGKLPCLRVSASGWRRSPPERPMPCW